MLDELLEVSQSLLEVAVLRKQLAVNQAMNREYKRIVAKAVQRKQYKEAVNRIDAAVAPLFKRQFADAASKLSQQATTQRSVRWEDEKYPGQPRDDQGRFGTGSGKFDAGSHAEQRAIYKTAKGMNEENNRALLAASGVRVSAPANMQLEVERMMAHAVSDTFEAKEMSGLTVEVKPLGNRHGLSKGKTLYIDEVAIREKGAGFGASVARHELEHTLLTRQKVPSGKQEGPVRRRAGMWALVKYGSMAKTNPGDARGFKEAAELQGINTRG